MRNHSAYNVEEDKPEDDPDWVFVEIDSIGSHLKEAKILLYEARENLQQARSDETRAVNRINELHKQFVKLQNKIIDQMPEGTDWKPRKESLNTSKDD